MTTQININFLNSAIQSEFKNSLAEIFEHSSWIPERAWSLRPFDSIKGLHTVMVEVVAQSEHSEQLSLLRAHPQLAGKEATTGTLTDSSNAEQSSANLNALSKVEMEKITQLNNVYMEKHGFPFIIAVKNHNKESIFSEFQKRVNNDRKLEFSTALEQVAFIARFRLDALIESN